MAGHIPKPFNRPSINLETSVARVWRPAMWDDIHEGDIVADRGLVVERTDVESEWSPYMLHRLQNGEVIYTQYGHEEVTVFAFVRVGG